MRWDGKSGFQDGVGYILKKEQLDNFTGNDESILWLKNLREELRKKREAAMDSLKKIKKKNP